MKFQIDIPTPIKDAAGTEYEPTGEFRTPLLNDWYLYGGNVALFQAASPCFVPYIILRPKFTWPAWLGGCCFAMDKCGELLWHESRPALWTDRWQSANRMLITECLQALCPTFTPPVITDWTQPVLNPNHKEGE